MQWSPRVTVAAVVERQGRFLMVEETSGGRLVINQPAGHLEEGETLEEAVARETLEETAWQVRPEAVIGIYLWRHPGKSVTFLRVAFHARALGHNPALELDEGIERALWLRRDELAEQQPRLRSPMVMRCLEDYLAGRRFPLSLLADMSMENLLDRAQSL